LPSVRHSNLTAPNTCRHRTRCQSRCNHRHRYNCLSSVSNIISDNEPISESYNTVQITAIEIIRLCMPKSAEQVIILVAEVRSTSPDLGPTSGPSMLIDRSNAAPHASTRADVAEPVPRRITFAFQDVATSGRVARAVGGYLLSPNEIAFFRQPLLSIITAPRRYNRVAVLTGCW